MISSRFFLPTCSMFFLMSGCVELDPSQIPGATTTTQATPAVAKFGPLDPGFSKQETLHFEISGYESASFRNVALTAEKYYDQIVRETGLYSYLTGDRYLLIVYRDKMEYQTKTKQPEWSRAVTVGSSIYTYEGPDFEPSLAHELTHVVFRGFMQDQAVDFRWLNEGLAVHSELQAMPEGERQLYSTRTRDVLKGDILPFSRMVFFVPATEEGRLVNAWYSQVHSVVEFLLASGSSLGFAQFLGDLRNGVSMDQALSRNYAGKFNTFADLERAWKASL